MEIAVDATISHPRPQVFEAYRDRLSELVPYLPNIRSVEVTQRREHPDGVVELVNEWQGGGELPAAVRGLISESMLRWTDYATWDAETLGCAWRTEVHVIPGSVLSSGTNRFHERAGKTVIEIRGDLRCDPDKLTMVPRMLRPKIASTLEKVLVSKIGPNLQQVAEGVGKLLDE